jgi:Secretion system C-terminal sorting domain
MKIQTFKTAVMLVVITLLCNFKSQSQSWTIFTYTASNDTVLDQATKCVYDGAGNSYWAARFYVSRTTRTGYMLWKINKNGITTAKQIITTNVPGATIEPIKDIKVISSNLYVLFDIKKAAPSPDHDVCTQKYDLTLSKKWESVYNHPNSKEDFGIQLNEGPKSGVLTAVLTGQDGGIINYARTNGAIINSYIYNNNNIQKETIRKIISIPSGVYFAGKNENLTTGISDMFITKLDSNLSLSWNKIYDASAGLIYDEAIDINPDAAGDILVTGNFESSTGAARVFYTKYNDTNGSRLWIRRLTNDEITAVAVFANSSADLISVVNGNPCRFVNVNGNTGALIASKGIFTNANINFQIADCINGVNEIYITGNFDSTYTSGGSPVTESGVIISKLDATGSRLWNEKISTTGQETYTASDIAIRSTNRLCYIVNVTNPAVANKTTHSIFASISAATGNRLAAETTVPTEITIYPNPVSEQLSIQFNVEADGIRVAELHDMNGRLIISEVVSGTEANHTHIIDVQALNKGLYLLRVNDGSTSTVTKVIIE